MSTKNPGLGASSIRQVVLARNVAHRFKSLSTNLVLQRRRNNDKGDFEVTHVDEPDLNSEHQHGKMALLMESAASSQRRSVGTFSGISYAANQKPPNTYRLEPTERFQTPPVQRIIKEIFETELIDLEYNAEICSQKTKSLCDMIKQRVKNLKFSRYKYIVVVFIGQKNDQCARVTSRCVWDTRFDSYTQYVFEGVKDLYAVGTVYGIYHE